MQKTFITIFFILFVVVIYINKLQFMFLPIIKIAIPIEEANEQFDEFYIIRKTASTGIEFIIVGDQDGMYERDIGINIDYASIENMYTELKYNRIFFEKNNYFICEGYLVQPDSREKIDAKTLIEKGHIDGSDPTPELFIENWEIIAPIDREFHIFLPKDYLTTSDYN